MIEVDVPGGSRLEIRYVVLDFSGTLAFDGKLLPGVREKLEELSKKAEVQVLTSDTFGTAAAELQGLPVKVAVLCGDDHAGQKERCVRNLGPGCVAAVGNGMNDAAMLKAAALGIAVLGGEGCAAAAIAAAHVVARDIGDALGVLLEPLRLKATLRR